MAEESHDFPQVSHFLIVSTRCIASVGSLFRQMSVKYIERPSTLLSASRNEKKTTTNKHTYGDPDDIQNQETGSCLQVTL